MKHLERFLWLAMGVIIGVIGTLSRDSASRPALANNDRHEDYIMATGQVITGTPAVGANIAGPFGGGGGRNFVPNIALPNGFSDGVWLLDYRSGKLLGTVVHSNNGKVLNWAEVDLVQEFKIAPKQNVHFLMTTGTQVNGQTALYVAETVTGLFGVYTMGIMPDARQGVVIRRHDATRFR